MATLRDALRQLLETDVTLTDILPGGILDASELPQDGGGAGDVPREDNGVHIKPFAVIRWRAANAFSAEVIQAERQSIEIYFYQHVGYNVIEQAVTRTKALLNRTRIAADDRALAYLEFTYTSGEYPAEELFNAACMFSRYSVTQIRK